MTSGKFYLNGLGLFYGDAGLTAFAAESLGVLPNGPEQPAAPELKQIMPNLNPRRVSAAGRLALSAAVQACFQGNWPVPLSPGAAPKTGLYIGSALGAAESSFLFMDSILEGGAQLASPTHFSHSVNNVFCGFLSMALNIQGPSCTVCQYGFSFAGALQAALSALAAGDIEFALVGGVEQSNSSMTRVQSHAVAPGNFQAPAHNCAVFFLVSANRAGRICIEPPVWSRKTAEIENKSQAAATFAASVLPGGAFASRLNRFYAGHPLEQALDLAAAVLTLQNSAPPDQDRQHGHGVPFTSVSCAYFDAQRSLAVEISVNGKKD